MFGGGEGFPGDDSDKEPAGDVDMCVQSLGREDPLEEHRAAISSILAWRIPWTEEPRSPRPIGSQRVGHD